MIKQANENEHFFMVCCLIQHSFMLNLTTTADDAIFLLVCGSHITEFPVSFSIITSNCV